MFTLLIVFNKGILFYEFVTENATTLGILCLWNTAWRHNTYAQYIFYLILWVIWTIPMCDMVSVFLEPVLPFVIITTFEYQAKPKLFIQQTHVVWFMISCVGFEIYYQSAEKPKLSELVGLIRSKKFI